MLWGPATRSDDGRRPWQRPVTTPGPEAGGSPEAPATGGLQSILGLGFGLAGAVGGTIGAGILRTPGLVAAELPDPTAILTVWLAGGLYALLGAVCVAELASRLPRAGGWYVYAREAFGGRIGFSVGWIDWLGHCTGIAWVAITIGEYGSALVPALEGQIKPLALAAVLLFSLIQTLGVRAGSGSQQLLSLAKAVAFLGLIAACFLLPPRFAESTALRTALSPPAESSLLAPAPAASPTATAPATTSTAATASTTPSLTTPTAVTPPATPRIRSWLGLMPALVLALQAVITTYDCWHSPIYFAEEFSRPAEDLPRSLIGGVLAVVLLYGLVNLALLHVLPVAVIAQSTLPVAEAAAVLFGRLSGQLITGLALVSLAGLINASIMGAPRILYGLSRDGLMPQPLATVNAGGTPVVSLALSALASALLVLVGNFTILLGVAAFLYVALYGSGLVALLLLRQRQTNGPPSFQIWGYPLPVLLMLAGSAAFLLGAIASDRRDSLLALGLMGLSLPLAQLLRADPPAASS